MSVARKILLFQFFFIAVSLILIEVTLRFIGYQPGDMKPKWLNFHPVDSLYLTKQYYTNSEGLLVADSASFTDITMHINEGGFRSPDFSKLDSAKKKILFIGDSFTWGMSASPVNNCFVDLVRNETGFEIINTGIPAADPVQYALLAQKYFPILKPDYVLVMFFTGNDIMRQDREVIPNEPFYYYTNAGAILADMDGIHFKTAQSAYNYFVNDKYYLRQPKNIFEKAIAKSSLLSRLYSVRFRIEEKLVYEQTVKNTSITKKYLKQIKNIAEQNHVPFKLVLIPEIKEADMPMENYLEKYSDLLSDTSLQNDWLIPQNSKTHFNDYTDAHLNNKGHRFYADFLKDFLKNYFQSK